MRYYSTQKEQCEGKLPVGVEKQGLCYRLCRFLGLYSIFSWQISKTLLSIMEKGIRAFLRMGGF